MASGFNEEDWSRLVRALRDADRMLRQAPSASEIGRASEAFRVFDTWLRDQGMSLVDVRREVAFASSAPDAAVASRRLYDLALKYELPTGEQRWLLAEFKNYDRIRSTIEAADRVAAEALSGAAEEDAQLIAGMLHDLRSLLASQWASLTPVARRVLVALFLMIVPMIHAQVLSITSERRATERHDELMEEMSRDDDKPTETPTDVDARLNQLERALQEVMDALTRELSENEE